MKILLVRPRPDPETIGLQHVMICEPLELEYLAGAVDALPVQVEIVDMILEKKPLAAFLSQHQPNLVAMTGYITHVGIIRDYARQIKAILPECRVAVGGVHAEVIPKDFVVPEIDYILISGDTKDFTALVEALVSGRGVEPRAGLYREGCLQHKSACQPHVRPDRSKTRQYRSRYYYMFHNPCALIKTSYGCPYACSFCFCRQVTGGNYLARPMPEVLEELQTIPEEEVYIVDDDFLLDAERLEAFCQGQRQLGLKKKYLVYGRADFIAAHPALLAQLRDVGLRAVIIGLESHQDAALASFNKKSDVATSEAAVQLLRELGVEVYATIILAPEYTAADFKGLYRWLRRLEISFVNLQPLTPLPGTDIFSEYAEDLLISREEYAKWDLAHLVLAPVHLSVRQYYWQILWLYYKIVLRPGQAGRLARQYGWPAVFKLTMGSSLVAWQYVKKIVRGR